MRHRPFATRLRRFANVVPFTPFVIELPAERLLIYHPEAVRVERAEVSFVEPGGTVHYFDSTSVIRLMALSDPHGFELDFGLPNGGLFDGIPFDDDIPF